ncbi:hypothetical protein FNV43_RR24420 [Rhamnella rubrinervis]|uniref:DUF1985 domain-containing protein n=1 Tax=Rhamnella rubrinervis TaxID=2594499 RepID=A0A8K0GQP5_9ROSA|nr:hypothetical protein FNV43_RR24420 [Rhamnella rubrinervis]
MIGNPGTPIRRHCAAIAPPSPSPSLHRSLCRRGCRTTFVVYNKLMQLDDKDDMVRFPLIYFLICSLIGKESQVSIDIQYLSMVEDLDYFSKYAWGSVSYNATISSMHRAMTLHNEELNESATYSFSEFLLAFQEYNRPDTYDNMAMGEDSEIRDREMTVVHDDNEVQFITPLKVVHHKPHVKKRADRLKSPLVVTTETRDTLKSTLSHPMDFDPKRAHPKDISKKFFEYLFLIRIKLLTMAYVKSIRNSFRIYFKVDG